MSTTPRNQWRERKPSTDPDEDLERIQVEIINQAGAGHLIADALTTLRGSGRLTHRRTVEAVVRQLTHQSRHVRGHAAGTLLFTSPRLRWAVPRLRAIHAGERDESVRHTLEKLLDRYPND